MKPTTLARIQTTEHPIVIRTTTKIAVSAAHIVLRCHWLGYFVIRVGSCSGVVPLVLSINLLRRALAHGGPGFLDLLGQELVRGIQSDRLLPVIKGLRNATQFRVNIADVLEDD